LPSGEVLYFIAAVAVVYNPETGTQTHFTGHNDDIKRYLMTVMSMVFIFEKTDK
jgi:hypothetical protein